MSTQETGSTGPTTRQIEESSTEPTTSAEEGEGSPAEELSLDLIFEILKNERRREVIRYLREHEQQVTLSDLAEHIAALENDTDIASITSSQRKRVYVGLYQCHLPKMADMGIVQFNQNRGIVSLGENAPQLYEYLDNKSSDTRPWHEYYLGLSGVGAVLFFVSLFAGSAVSIAALGVLCLAIGGCSAFHAMEIGADQDN